MKVQDWGVLVSGRYAITLLLEDDFLVRNVCLVLVVIVGVVLFAV